MAIKKPDNWYALSGDDVLARLETTQEDGLSTQQAQQHLLKYGKNELPSESGTNFWQILIGQFTEVMVIVLLAAAVVSIIIGDSKDAIVIMAIVVLNAALGFFQEYQAEQALAALGAIETLVASLADGAAPYAPATADTDTVATGAPASILADSLATVAFTDSHRRALSALLQRAFDDPDLRIRLRARACAEATDLLPPSLIPSAASLRETLPPVDRHPDQPAVRTAFTAPDVRVVTDRGTFTIRLAADIAPNTCAAFLALVQRGFHDDLTFHRVVPDFVIQGGCPRGDGWGGPGWTIRSEWSRRPYRRGTVGIAHSGKDTGGSQWFVCHSDQPHLDGRQRVFEGLRVLNVPITFITRSQPCSRNTRAFPESKARS